MRAFFQSSKEINIQARMLYIYQAMQYHSTTLCRVCLSTSPIVSSTLGVCADCIKKSFKKIQPEIRAMHAATRKEFDLPAEPPDHRDGVSCQFCANRCKIGEGRKGFCGLRTVTKGRLVHRAGASGNGILKYYRDPLPTNCVADWVCDGYKHAGSHNLAVFYEACTMNCLFCQNWHFRRTDPDERKKISAEQLAAAVNPSTFCVCFFGGDPSAQMMHALSVSKLLAEQKIRICWETNGMMNPKHLEKAIGYSLKTGGCIKFDLKAWDDELHRALTGISNSPVKENFKMAVQRTYEKTELPLVVASTLLVPGYIDAEQVHKIAGYIASLNPEIPYSLLGFAPQFYMNDLPFTSARHAREAESAALEAGLTNVRIGNKHLLGSDY
jgi:pyruvate formate lyase activating enzyme